MDLFDQELAEVLADEGIRYVLRRNPVRAKKSGTPARETGEAPGTGRKKINTSQTIACNARGLCKSRGSAKNSYR